MSKNEPYSTRSRLTYKDYRSFGHGRVVSFILGFNEFLWWGLVFIFIIFDLIVFGVIKI